MSNTKKVSIRMGILEVIFSFPFLQKLLFVLLNYVI
jgi:hypothetical protein